MLPRCLFISLLATFCLCQYELESGMRADIAFNADNDRFDVGDIISAQNRMFRDQPTPMDYDTRRSFDELPLVEVLKKDRRRYQQARNANARRMSFGSDDDFRYQEKHDRVDDEDHELDAYNQNLDTFRRQKPVVEESDLRRFFSTNLAKKLAIHAQLNNPGNMVPIQYSASKENLQDVVLNYLHGGKEVKNGRRMSDTNPEGEIMLHYAVPLKMKVRGYMEMPIE